VHKTNADYKRSDAIIGNPRNPFKELSDLNYDYESDDSENDQRYEKLSAADDLNSSQINEGDGQELTYHDQRNKNYEEYFRKPGKAIDIHVLDWDEPSRLDEFLKTKILYNHEKIELPNKYELPRISDTVLRNLKKICTILHGSYASKTDLIDSICIKLNLDRRDLEPTIWKLCTRE
jgi:predicted nucleotidyltransferase